MKSPFPGMDPYLESRWSDVHVTLISAIKRFLQPILPEGLRARAQEHILFETVERWIKIVDMRDGDHLLTAIEAINSDNKATGAHNERYRRKLDEYKGAAVSVVEIDLLRRPSRATLEVGQEDLPENRREAYLACIRKAWSPEVWEVFPLSLRKPLPIIRVPLRKGGPDAPLDLQRLIDTAYEEGAYAGDIDYSKPPEPPLEAEDASWAQGVIKSA